MDIRVAVACDSCIFFCLILGIESKLKKRSLIYINKYIVVLGNIGNECDESVLFYS